MNAPRILPRITSALPFLVFYALVAIVFFRFTAEDAYIVERCAINVVRHGEWAFNRGEPVNVLTSPLHGLVAAALLRMFGGAIVPYKWTAAIAVPIVLAWTAHRAVDARWRGVFFAATLMSPFLVLWTVGGLETAILLCVTTAFTARALRNPAGDRDLIALSALGAASFLARFDSIFFVAPPLVAGVWRARRRPRAVAGFLPALRGNADDIEAYLQSHAIADGPPRMLTFAAGVVPARLPDVYVFEELVSYRRDCRVPAREAAHFIHILTPRHGTLAEQLGDLTGQVERVSSREFVFDGARERSEVSFNPTPVRNRLSARVDLPCTP